jgi:hypothetical protein
MKHVAILVSALIFAFQACAGQPLVAELRERLARNDVASVNAYLSAHWESKMAPLGRLVQRCNADALRLSIALLDTTNVEALEAHAYSLELATAKCPKQVLPLATTQHVQRLCSVASFEEAYPGVDLSREIRRRIDILRKDERLAASDNGRACVKAYEEAQRALPQ